MGQIEAFADTMVAMLNELLKVAIYHERVVRGSDAVGK